MKKRTAIGGGRRFSMFLLLSAILFSFTSFANAMTVDGQTQNLEERKNEERMKPVGSVPGRTEEGQEGKDLEQEVDKARFSFERNQTRIRVARNLISNTIKQLELEKTELGKLPEQVVVLEEKMTEVENLYKEYLNRVTLFQNKKGSYPGRIEEVFSKAKEKKQSMLDFYKDTFRVSLEEALNRSEENKK